MAKSQIAFSSLLATDLKSNLRSIIFVLNLTLLFDNFSQHRKQRDVVQSVGNQ